MKIDMRQSEMTFRIKVKENFWDIPDPSHCGYNSEMMKFAGMILTARKIDHYRPTYQQLDHPSNFEGYTRTWVWDENWVEVVEIFGEGEEEE